MKRKERREEGDVKDKKDGVKIEQKRKTGGKKKREEIRGENEKKTQEIKEIKSHSIFFLIPSNENIFHQH